MIYFESFLLILSCILSITLYFDFSHIRIYTDVMSKWRSFPVLCYLKQTYFSAIKRTKFNLTLFVLHAVDPLGNPALCWNGFERTSFDLGVTEISGYLPIRCLDCFSILKLRFIRAIRKAVLIFEYVYLKKELYIHIIWTNIYIWCSRFFVSCLFIKILTNSFNILLINLPFICDIWY